MPSLYNCKHSGDQYRISKFDSDFNLESSYLCDLIACECPAGHRPTCRHRQMLPKFIARNAIGTNWFFDHDRGGWVQGWKEEQATEKEIYGEGTDEPIDIVSVPVIETVTIAKVITLPNDASPEDIANAFGNLLAPAGLGQSRGEFIVEGAKTGRFTNPLAVSRAEFSDVVASTVGNENEGSIPSALPLTASGPSPSPTIRRRV